MSAEETTKNFWEVWNNFQWPEPQPISYRCYYRDDGTPELYTMEDLPGRWIEVPQEIYIQGPLNARVIDGKLKIFEPKTTVNKLIPGVQTGVPCATTDICIVVDHTQPHIKWGMITDEIS